MKEVGDIQNVVETAEEGIDKEATEDTKAVEVEKAAREEITELAEDKYDANQNKENDVTEEKSTSEVEEVLGKPEGLDSEKTQSFDVQETTKEIREVTAITNEDANTAKQGLEDEDILKNQPTELAEDNRPGNDMMILETKVEVPEVSQTTERVRDIGKQTIDNGDATEEKVEEEHFQVKENEDDCDRETEFKEEVKDSSNSELEEVTEEGKLVEKSEVSSKEAVEVEKAATVPDVAIFEEKDLATTFESSTKESMEVERAETEPEATISKETNIATTTEMSSRGTVDIEKATISDESDMEKVVEQSSREVIFEEVDSATTVEEGSIEVKTEKLKEDICKEVESATTAEESSREDAEGEKAAPAAAILDEAKGSEIAKQEHIGKSTTMESHVEQSREISWEYEKASSIESIEENKKQNDESTNITLSTSLEEKEGSHQHEAKDILLAEASTQEKEGNDGTDTELVESKEKEPKSGELLEHEPQQDEVEVVGQSSNLMAVETDAGILSETIPNTSIKEEGIDKEGTEDTKAASEESIKLVEDTYNANQNKGDDVMEEKSMSEVEEVLRNPEELDSSEPHFAEKTQSFDVQETTEEICEGTARANEDVNTAKQGLEDEDILKDQPNEPAEDISPGDDITVSETKVEVPEVSQATERVDDIGKQTIENDNATEEKVEEEHFQEKENEDECDREREFKEEVKDSSNSELKELIEEGKLAEKSEVSSKEVEMEKATTVPDVVAIFEEKDLATTFESSTKESMEVERAETEPEVAIAKETNTATTEVSSRGTVDIEKATTSDESDMATVVQQGSREAIFEKADSATTVEEGLIEVETEKVVHEQKEDICKEVESATAAEESSREDIEGEKAAAPAATIPDEADLNTSVEAKLKGIAQVANAAPEPETVIFEEPYSTRKAEQISEVVEVEKEEDALLIKRNEDNDNNTGLEEITTNNGQETRKEVDGVGSEMNQNDECTNLKVESENTAQARDSTTEADDEKKSDVKTDEQNENVVGLAEVKESEEETLKHEEEIHETPQDEAKGSDIAKKEQIGESTTTESHVDENYAEHSREISRDFEKASTIESIEESKKQNDESTDTTLPTSLEEKEGSHQHEAKEIPLSEASTQEKEDGTDTELVESKEEEPKSGELLEQEPQQDEVEVVGQSSNVKAVETDASILSETIANTSMKEEGIDKEGTEDTKAVEVEKAENEENAELVEDTYGANQNKENDVFEKKSTNEVEEVLGKPKGLDSEKTQSFDVQETTEEKCEVTARTDEDANTAKQGLEDEDILKDKPTEPAEDNSPGDDMMVSERKVEVLEVIHETERVDDIGKQTIENDNATEEKVEEEHFQEKENEDEFDRETEFKKEVMDSSSSELKELIEEGKLVEKSEVSPNEAVEVEKATTVPDVATFEEKDLVTTFESSTKESMEVERGETEPEVAISEETNTATTAEVSSRGTVDIEKATISDESDMTTVVEQSSREAIFEEVDSATTVEEGSIEVEMEKLVHEHKEDAEGEKAAPAAALTDEADLETSVEAKLKEIAQVAKAAPEPETAIFAEPYCTGKAEQISEEVVEVEKPAPGLQATVSNVTNLVETAEESLKEVVEVENEATKHKVTSSEEANLATSLEDNLKEAVKVEQEVSETKEVVCEEPYSYTTTEDYSTEAIEEGKATPEATVSKEVDLATTSEDGAKEGDAEDKITLESEEPNFDTTTDVKSNEIIPVVEAVPEPEAVIFEEPETVEKVVHSAKEVIEVEKPATEPEVVVSNEAGLVATVEESSKEAVEEEEEITKVAFSDEADLTATTEDNFKEAIEVEKEATETKAATYEEWSSATTVEHGLIKMVETEKAVHEETISKEVDLAATTSGSEETHLDSTAEWKSKEIDQSEKALEPEVAIFKEVDSVKATEESSKEVLEVEETSELEATISKEADLATTMDVITKEDIEEEKKETEPEVAMSEAVETTTTAEEASREIVYEVASREATSKEVDSTTVEDNLNEAAKVEKLDESKTGIFEEADLSIPVEESSKEVVEVEPGVSIIKEVELSTTAEESSKETPGATYKEDDLSEVVDLPTTAEVSSKVAIKEEEAAAVPEEAHLDTTIEAKSKEISQVEKAPEPEAAIFEEADSAKEVEESSKEVLNVEETLEPEAAISKETDSATRIDVISKEVVAGETVETGPKTTISKEVDTDILAEDIPKETVDTGEVAIIEGSNLVTTVEETSEEAIIEGVDLSMPTDVISKVTVDQEKVEIKPEVPIFTEVSSGKTIGEADISEESESDLATTVEEASREDNSKKTEVSSKEAVEQEKIEIEPEVTSSEKVDTTATTEVSSRDIVNAEKALIYGETDLATKVEETSCEEKSKEADLSTEIEVSTKEVVKLEKLETEQEASISKGVEATNIAEVRSSEIVDVDKVATSEESDLATTVEGTSREDSSKEVDLSTTIEVSSKAPKESLFEEVDSTIAEKSLNEAAKVDKPTESKAGISKEADLATTAEESSKEAPEGQEATLVSEVVTVENIDLFPTAEESLRKAVEVEKPSPNPEEAFSKEADSATEARDSSKEAVEVEKEESEFGETLSEKGDPLAEVKDAQGEKVAIEAESNLKDAEEETIAIKPEATTSEEGTSTTIAMENSKETIEVEKAEIKQEENFELANAKKFEGDFEVGTRDQSHETFLESNTSKDEEDRNDVQYQSFEPTEQKPFQEFQGQQDVGEKTKASLEAEYHVMEWRETDGTVKAASLAEKVCEEIQETTVDETVRLAKDEENDIKDLYTVPIQDEKVNEFNPESAEYCIAKDNNDQTEVKNLECQKTIDVEKKILPTKETVEETVEHQSREEHNSISIIVESKEGKEEDTPEEADAILSKVQEISKTNLEEAQINKLVNQDNVLEETSAPEKDGADKVEERKRDSDIACESQDRELHITQPKETIKEHETPKDASADEVEMSKKDSYIANESQRIELHTVGHGGEIQEFPRAVTKSQDDEQATIVPAILKETTKEQEEMPENANANEVEESKKDPNAVHESQHDGKQIAETREENEAAVTGTEITVVQTVKEEMEKEQQETSSFTSPEDTTKEQETLDDTHADKVAVSKDDSDIANESEHIVSCTTKHGEGVQEVSGAASKSRDDEEVVVVPTILEGATTELDKVLKNADANEVEKRKEDSDNIHEFQHHKQHIDQIKEENEVSTVESIQEEITKVEQETQEDIKEEASITVDRTLESSSQLKEIEQKSLQQEESKKLEDSKLGSELKSEDAESSHEEKVETLNEVKEEVNQTFEKELESKCDGPKAASENELGTEMREVASESAAEVTFHEVHPKSEAEIEKGPEATVVDLITKENQSKKTIDEAKSTQNEHKSEMIFTKEDGMDSITHDEESTKEIHVEYASRTEDCSGEQNVKSEMQMEEVYEKIEKVDTSKTDEEHSDTAKILVVEGPDRDVLEAKNIQVSATDEADRNCVKEEGTSVIIRNDITEVKTTSEKELGVEISKEVSTGVEGTREIPDEEKTSDLPSEMLKLSKPEPHMTTEAMVLTGNRDIPQVLQDSTKEATERIEVESEVKGVDHGSEGEVNEQEKEAIEETMSTEESGKISLFDIMQRSKRERKVVRNITENEQIPMASKAELKNEAETIKTEKTKSDEEKDEDDGDDGYKKNDSDAPIMVEAARDIDVKATQKKSHNILSGVGSRVKHSISKVKKAITGKSSHPKQHSPK